MENKRNIHECFLWQQGLSSGMTDYAASERQGYFSGRGWRIAGRVWRNVARLANCIFVLIGLLLTILVVFADWGSNEMISLHAIRNDLGFVITTGVMGGLSVYIMLGNYE